MSPQHGQDRQRPFAPQIVGVHIFNSAIGCVEATYCPFCPRGNTFFEHHKSFVRQRIRIMSNCRAHRDCCQFNRWEYPRPRRANQPAKFPSERKRAGTQALQDFQDFQELLETIVGRASSSSSKSVTGRMPSPRECAHHPSKVDQSWPKLNKLTCRLLRHGDRDVVDESLAAEQFHRHVLSELLRMI